MNKEQVLGIIRHTLTFVGGFVIAKGLLEEGIVLEIIGGVVTLVGTVWSIVDKIKGK
jgi:hypothetical protein